MVHHLKVRKRWENTRTEIESPLASWNPVNRISRVCHAGTHNDGLQHDVNQKAKEFDVADLGVDQPSNEPSGKVLSNSGRTKNHDCFTSKMSVSTTRCSAVDF